MTRVKSRKETVQKNKTKNKKRCTTPEGAKQIPNKVL